MNKKNIRICLTIEQAITLEDVIANASTALDIDNSLRERILYSELNTIFKKLEKKTSKKLNTMKLELVKKLEAEE
jgi:hypothetical protein